MSDDKAQVIQVPNLLRAKIGNKEGPDLDEIVRDAEAALSDMQEQGEGWIRDYLQTINEALEQARASVPPDPEAITLICKTSHELKGQAGTFGYPLLTVAAKLLQRFIEHDETVAARNLDLIAAHVDFMNLVVQNSVQGDGGPQEDQLLTALETAAQKLSKP